MGESYPGGEHYKRSDETKEIDEIKEHLKEVDRLLAKLVERTQELTAIARQAVRNQINNHLLAIGVNGIEDYEGLMAVYERINDSFQKLTPPLNFPSKEEFQRKLAATKSQSKQDLPPIPQQVSATEVAMYATGDWLEVEGRSGASLLDYLYKLAIIMSNKVAYTTIFDDKDAIQINQEWQIQNGRHRALALKSLGANHIRQNGMNSWVSVRKEE